MAVVRQTLAHPPAVVFDALVTPETYPHWLIGCRQIRAVDADWPDVGSRFHHRVGVVGPLTVNDSTEVLGIDPPHELVLEVRFRPLGRGRVTFTLAPGGLEDTVVTIDEVPIGTLAVAKPALDPITAHRNRLSLQRLGEHLDAAAGSVRASRTGAPGTGPG